MNILHISTYSTGGAGIAAMRLHRSLLENNVNSRFIQVSSILTDSNDYIFQATHFHNLRYRILNRLNLLHLLSKKEKIEQKIQKCNTNYECVSIPFTYYNLEKHPLVQSADIIHLHWIAGFLDYPTFFNKIKKPMIWTFHDMNPFLGIFHYENDIKNNIETELYNLEINTRTYKKNLYKTLKNLTVVTPSNWLKNKCLEYNTFEKYNVNVIPYTYNNTYNNKSKEELKKYFKIYNEAPIFFFIADYIDVYRKGFDLLEKALLEFNECQINLIILGSNSHCCTAALKQNTLLNIIPINKTSDIDIINSMYCIADYTIIPSREDNLPNVMLESFGMGTPIVCFKNSGMAEYINQDNGILIDKITSSHLLEGIKLAIRNIANGAINNALIKANFQKTFSFQNTTQRYIDLYKKSL